MGLFDTIFIEKQLPLPKQVRNLDIDWTKIDFQTKDFENFMDTYKIKESGQLMLLKKKCKWVEKQDGPFGGHIETISKRWVKSKFTGTVNFYTNVCSNEEQKFTPLFEFASKEKIDSATGYDYFVEFLAKIHYGQVKKISFFKISSHSIREQLINHNKWLQVQKEREAKPSYKIKSFIKKLITFRRYNKIINLLTRFVGFQQKIIHKLY